MGNHLLGTDIDQRILETYVESDIQLVESELFPSFRNNEAGDNTILGRTSN